MPKKNGKLRPIIRSFLTKSVYKQTVFQNGDSQVSKTIYNGQQLGCLHRSDGCISSCSDTSDIQKISLVYVRTAGLSVHSLTVRNVPKFMCLHTINGYNSSTLTSMCRISLSIPRRLANKRSDSQSTYLSHKIHSSNGTKSGFHTKSKEIRFDINTTIHLYRYGISNSTEDSQSSSEPSKSSYSDHQNNSFSDSSFDTNFSFSFGQTQCSSRLYSSRQTAFTTSANVRIIGLKTPYSSIRSSSYDQQYDQIPFKMVDEKVIFSHS